MRLLDSRLDIFKNCNYHCVFCGEPAKEQSPAIPIQTLDKLFPILNKSCWSVYLSCGGEPLLHPQFNLVMEKVRVLMPKPDVSIVTNGFNLTSDKCDSIVNSGITRIFISLHTINPALYPYLTGTSSSALEKVKTNIENLVRIRGKRKFPNIIITSIAMKSTLPEMDALADWVIKAGVDALNIQWLLPDYNPAMKEEIVGFSKETKLILDSIQKKVKKNNRFFYYPYSLGYEKILSMLSDLSLVKNRYNYLFYLAKKYTAAIQKKQCRVLGNTAIINHDGTVQLCHKNVLSLPSILVGNKNLQTEIRKTNRRIKRETIPECNSCPYLNKG